MILTAEVRSENKKFGKYLETVLRGIWPHMTGCGLLSTVFLWGVNKGSDGMDL